MSPDEPLLKANEVAARFRIDLKTVSRWVRDGRLDCIRTPGGHMRFTEQHLSDALERARKRAEDHGW